MAFEAPPEVHQESIGWIFTWSKPTQNDLYDALSCLGSYEWLLEPHVTIEEATRRLRILRRAYREYTPPTKKELQKTPVTRAPTPPAWPKYEPRCDKVGRRRRARIQPPVSKGQE